MAELSAHEIYMLQLINRARLDPASEASRYGIDLNSSLAAGTISTAPKPPLAPNALLHDAARAHSQWMIDTDIFSHTGASNSSAGTRMSAAGYAFTGSWTWGENISWRGTTGSLGNLTPYIEEQHKGLFLSAGHRQNMLNGAFREAGIGQATGVFAASGTAYNASMITQNFARSGTATFLAGVIYNDLDADNFYDPGEGVAGVTISINGQAVATSTAAGAYVVALAPGTYDLRMSSGSAGAYETTVTMSGDNIQVNAKTSQFAAIPQATTFTIAATIASRPEGTGPATPFTFSVARSGNLSAPHSVAWTVAGTTGAGTLPANAADFAGSAFPSGTLTFAPGEASRTITVQVAGDALGEFNERFAVTLHTPSSGATIATASAQGLIWNDDTSLAIGAAISRAEGNAGTTTYQYAVTRAGTALPAGTVAWSVAGGGIAGTVAATASDFAGGTIPGGILSFAAGVASQTITINVAGDTNPEGGFNESFTVTLAAASAGMTLAKSTTTGVIYNDDTIYGTAGNDILTGTPGPDLFVIGTGQDSITAGLGTDTFRFLPSAIGPAAANAFTIQDFTRSDGERLDLSRIDAIAGTAANDAFTFIGTAPFSGTPGELRWTDQGATHLIQGNLNSDPAADLTITLKAAGPIDTTWFVL